MVEHLNVNQRVLGSSPKSYNNHTFLDFFSKYCGVEEMAVLARLITSKSLVRIQPPLLKMP